VEPIRDDFDRSLLESVEHLRNDRSEADILYEILLKLGLDLCQPIEKRKIAEKDVHAVGGGVLLVCLAQKVDRSEAEALRKALSIGTKRYRRPEARRASSGTTLSLTTLRKQSCRDLAARRSSDC